MSPKFNFSRRSHQQPEAHENTKLALYVERELFPRVLSENFGAITVDRSNVGRNYGASENFYNPVYAWATSTQQENIREHIDGFLYVGMPGKQGWIKVDVTTSTDQGILSEKFERQQKQGVFVLQISEYELDKVGNGDATYKNLIDNRLKNLIESAGQWRGGKGITPVS